MSFPSDGMRSAHTSGKGRGIWPTSSWTVPRVSVDVSGPSPIVVGILTTHLRPSPDRLNISVMLGPMRSQPSLPCNCISGGTRHHDIEFDRTFQSRVVAFPGFYLEGGCVTVRRRMVKL